jgi:hypothetical protein
MIDANVHLGSIAIPRAVFFSDDPYMYRFSLFGLATAFCSIGTIFPLSEVTIGAAVAANPAEIARTIEQIDAAATSRQIGTLMSFYAPNFTHGDGWNRATWESTVKETWTRYQSLNYRTRVIKVQPVGNGFDVETATTLMGTQKIGSRSFLLQGELRSLQRFVNGKIERQQILAERSKLTHGNGLTVDFRLPERVTVGTEFSFDAIVDEPIGEDLLLGGMKMEPVRTNSYSTSAAPALQPLPGGGLFKVLRAANTAGDYWVSATFVRSTGIISISQRFSVVARTRS